MALSDPAELSELNDVFASVLGVAARLAGIAALGMIVVGGFKFLTAGGDPKAAEQAKHTLTWAIAGLATLIGAWFLLRLIFALTFTSGNPLDFDICIAPPCQDSTPPTPGPNTL
ncbi:MAG: hypothetical protein A2784_01965 [Candidatus Chisholmbacteria bacterium RIFCSPHIGHO2_01_FULL_48_12]|uniref:Uncharacterized protein n=1 Tax=Candidatus Chisholmbacteria bacterium RIFCSPHIGHO2_01_FULL_48_12 TaxID=1797589 RepID=A0A1G1VQ42_9BACT|nr:MAG: hypothetical protein A2784_01965 [Candidatus Chisholmbacteria bacterium RIFCSPHIGHO2_01_FULL_48_12]